ncbi:alpha/beta fold hydrolase [Nocardia cyriacigeorgica]|uniref:alpha/beta fold hydrolase n=1 Tax=Nocardia cyriacigeorgica TaxID=135487 RepID=UPI0014860129|nr:alpha/beta fold hydrolase [Nocardia cyriacigeorgica]
MITFAVGTHGQGDQCAPSKLFTGLVHYSPPRDLMFEYETAFIDLLIARGIAVVVTDYQGLGTPGTHTYFNRAAQAHAVLDAARAAQKLPGTSIPGHGPIGIWGYSQGGGAAAAAAEAASSYAPDLDVRGSYIGAPIADAAAVLSNIDGTIIAGAIGYYLNGAMAGHPRSRPVIEEMLNPAGKAMLETVHRQCLFETAVDFGYQSSRQWTTSGRSIPDLLAENPDTRTILDADRVGYRTPNAPVLLATGDNDDIVPAGQARQLAATWCARGASVDIVEIDVPPLFAGLGVGHNLIEYAANLGWAQPLLDRIFNGAPIHDTCDG